jgi:hypothetical protein
MGRSGAYEDGEVSMRSVLIAAYSFPPETFSERSGPYVSVAIAVFIVVAMGFLIVRLVKGAGAADIPGWGLAAIFWGVVPNTRWRDEFLVARFADPLLLLSLLGAATALIAAASNFKKMHGERVVAALGLVGFVLLVSLSKINMRVPAQRTLCLNNLRNLQVALFSYAQTFGSLPPSAGDSDRVPRSWRVEVLPFLAQGPLRARYNNSAAWDSPQNERWARTQIKLFQCPSNWNPVDEKGRYFTAFAAITGDDTAFSDEGRTRFLKHFGKSDSSTILLIEACGQEIVWSEPRDVDVDSLPIGINLDGASPTTSAGIASSYHPGGANSIQTNGAGRFLSSKIDPKVLKALLSIDSHVPETEF